MRRSISFWPWPASPARPTTSPASTCSTGVSPSPGKLDPPLARESGAPAGAVSARATAPISSNRWSRDRPAAGTSATTCASFMTTMRWVWFRTSLSIWVIRMQARPCDARARDSSSSCSAAVGIQRRGRLVEDDELRRRIALGEGAGDLDHLALADRKIRDGTAHVDPVAGKDLVQHAGDQRARPLLPAEAAQARMDNQRVLQALRLGQSDNSWKTQRMPRRVRLGRVIGPGDGLRPRCRNVALIRQDDAHEDVHQRALAGAVMADQARETRRGRAGDRPLSAPRPARRIC